MSGIIAALSTVTEIFDKSSEGLSGKELVKVLGSRELSMIRSDGSMLKLLGNYIVEPVCVVTDDLKESEIIDKLIGLHSDMFTGFYMQTLDILRYMYGMTDRDAITITGTDNGGTGKVLLKGAEIALEDMDRDFLAEALSEDFVISTESNKGSNSDYYNERLYLDKRKLEFDKDKFKYQKEHDKSNDSMRVAEFGNRNSQHRDLLEQKNKDRKEKKKDRKERVKDREQKERLARIKDRVKPGSELSQGRKDLLIPNALQRTVDITIVRRDKDGSMLTIVIPVTIKTQLIYTTPDNILNSMAPNNDDKSFMSRLDDYRASAISLYDFAFASDIVKKYKHNKLKDKDELLKLMQSRKLSANSKAVDHGVIGFEKFYTMYIVSKEASVKLENFVRGKLKSHKAKENFLEQAYGLSIAVVDEDYERVKLYLKDLKGDTDLTFKTIIKKDKNDTNMDELVKALLAGRGPQF